MPDTDNLKNQIGAILGELGNLVRSAIADDPYEILAYYGYANARRAHVYGRVVEKLSVSAAGDADSALRNLLNTYRRADSDPFAHAEVRISFAGSVAQLQADSEGYFGGWIDMNEKVSDEWAKYETELVQAAADAPSVKATGEVLVPPDSARFCVVSDIDDTVIQSRVSNFLQAARTVMLGNSRTRLPFPGVAAFYEALRKGKGGDERNPIFYVSSSPWNIHDVISEFMHIQKVPKGPLILRDWDISLSALDSSRHFSHKGVAIRNLLQLYPAMQFILIGDTSQHDPEIYRQIVGEFPNRISAIYIRDVNRNAERKASVARLAEEVLAAGSILVLAEDTLGAARHAAEQGWISVEALPEVGEEKRADEGRDDTKVAAPDGGKPVSGEPPKVIA